MSSVNSARRGRNQQEHQDQVVVMLWAELNKKKYPCLGFIYAIPNMSMAHVNFRVKMKAEGLKKGMLDWCLPWPIVCHKMHGDLYSFCGLYVEMKVPPVGYPNSRPLSKISNDQKEWIAYFLDVGYEVKVAWSADEAIGHLKEYVNPDEKNWIDFQ